MMGFCEVGDIDLVLVGNWCVGGCNCGFSDGCCESLMMVKIWLFRVV